MGGYFAMNLTFPAVLGWVLGGNISNLRDSNRMPHCDLDEAPKGFHESVSCLHSTNCPVDVCAFLYYKAPNKVDVSAASCSSPVACCCTLQEVLCSMTDAPLQPQALSRWHHKSTPCCCRSSAAS